jgi:putative DNA primase/helicase
MTRAPLLPHHRSHLRDSAVSADVINARGYQTVGRPTAGDPTSSKNLLKRCGIPGWARRDDARYPGLLIPLYRATGEHISWQYRPDRPPNDPETGKVRKYAAQVGRASVLDVHPANRDRVADPTQELWLTEGIKKGDALTSAGACAITLSGVFNWRGRLGTLGDWEDVPLKDRKSVV